MASVAGRMADMAAATRAAVGDDGLSRGRLLDAVVSSSTTESVAFRFVPKDADASFVSSEIIVVALA